MKIPPRRLPGRGTRPRGGPASPPTAGTVRVGRIVGPFGLDGRVKVEPDTDYPARFRRGAEVLIDGLPYRVRGSSWYRAQARLSLEGVETVEAAEALRWKDVYARADERPAMPVDEFYEADLIGCRVKGEDGRDYGTVDRILHAPAQDLLVVGDAMVPMVRQFVIRVDVAAKTIVIRPIPGLMEPEEEPA